MSRAETGAVILAAGKGTRMHSERPKVLAELLGEPMLAYVLGASGAVFGNAVWTVVGHGAEAVQAAFPGRGGWILQDEQLGTGHALQVAWKALAPTGIKRLAVINGDTPLMGAATLDRFVAACEHENVDIGFITLTLDDPAAFGRVVRENGQVACIVEAKDYDVDRFGPEPREINAGIYYLNMETMAPLLDALSNDNNSGELYITDLVALAVGAGLRVHGEDSGNDPSLLGINSPRELVAAEELLRASIVGGLMENGVLVRSPGSVRVGPRCRVEPGAELCGPCELFGGTAVAAGAVVQSHCVLRDSEVASGAVIKNFSHLEQARVGADCQVGPYARLRPGADMHEGAKVGNFVEMKKAVLGAGAKASHLTYLGDAEVGAGANIGAGTITCNYDGKNKFRTVIGEGAFIGSNTALVAPVTVGPEALIGAGSVITKDVPEGRLAVSRGKQVILPRRGRE